MTREEMINQDKINNVKKSTAEEFSEEALESLKAEPKFIARLKCKPTYNFQSIEFDWDLTTENRVEMFELYGQLLDYLMDVAPDQPEQKKGKKVKQEELATEAQLNTLKRFHIPYRELITKKEASKLLAENLGKK